MDRRRGHNTGNVVVKWPVTYTLRVGLPLSKTKIYRKPTPNVSTNSSTLRQIHTAGAEATNLDFRRVGRCELSLQKSWKVSAAEKRERSYQPPPPNT